MGAPIRPHIALVDSGIGGFSILAQIEQRCPNVSISYFMDSLYLPYGELSEPILLNRLARIVSFLQQRAPLDLIVIACNTASIQSLDFLRSRFSQTFVGVVPAIKPAALLTQSGCIGLLATPATVVSTYIDRLIIEFASQHKVIKIGSSPLVYIAETLFWQDSLDSSAEQLLNDLCLNQFDEADTVVLGCTHFPLITEVIRSLLPAGVVLVDSGQAIAKQVDRLLGEHPNYHYNDAPSKSKSLYCTNELSNFKVSKLHSMLFDVVEYVEV